MLVGYKEKCEISIKLIWSFVTYKVMKMNDFNDFFYKKNPIIFIMIYKINK